MSATRQRQSGAVSLFMVVFAMLLMSVITISFLRIMTADQTQSSNNDLAQSAYDSAEAGVEDAKRALIWYINECKDGASTGCSTAESSIASNECNAAIRVANNWTGDDGEVKVQQSTNVNESGESVDQALDQAYTCVTLQLDTDDYLASIGADQSILVPLSATDAFDTITLQWFSEDDLTNAGEAVSLNGSDVPPMDLSRDWPVNRPSILRTQFMQVGESFTLSDFDYVSDESQSNANTLFLYPATSAIGRSSAPFVGTDIRANEAGDSGPAAASDAPLPVGCEPTIPSGGYACEITLDLPDPIGETERSSDTVAFLRLTSLYVASHVRITLENTQFNDVQPIVDSTGRANDLFRRIQSRVELYDTSTFPYPDGAVDVSGPFCKDFGVTDTRYLAGSCTP